MFANTLELTVSWIVSARIAGAERLRNTIAKEHMVRIVSHLR